jgi:hypothetical protein
VQVRAGRARVMPDRHPPMGWNRRGDPRPRGSARPRADLASGAILSEARLALRARSSPAIQPSALVRRVRHSPEDSAANTHAFLLWHTATAAGVALVMEPAPQPVVAGDARALTSSIQSRRMSFPCIFFRDSCFTCRGDTQQKIVKTTEYLSGVG